MLKIVKLTTQELEAIFMLVGDVDAKISNSVWVYKLYLKIGNAFEEAAKKDPEWKLEESDG
tara:strand:+ start:4166 stop:4348 length:183 start_codon:yes stop_codon:yes gene_type:complete